MPHITSTLLLSCLFRLSFHRHHHRIQILTNYVFYFTHVKANSRTKKEFEFNKLHITKVVICQIFGWVEVFDVNWFNWCYPGNGLRQTATPPPLPLQFSMQNGTLNGCIYSFFCVHGSCLFHFFLVEWSNVFDAYLYLLQCKQLAFHLI